MNDHLMVFIAAVFVSWLMTPLVRVLCVRFNILDLPGPNKLQKTAVPRAGGLAIFAGFSAAMLYAFLCGGFDLAFLLKIFIGAAAMMLLGLLDDLNGISFLLKFAVQASVAAALILNGVMIGFIPAFLSGPLTFFWIVGVTNAINLQDGMDGLASGISFVAGAAFFVIGLLHGNALLVFLSLALSGSCLGFLRHNFPPASIFMGDTGSLFLGYMLSVLGIMSTFKAVDPVILFAPLIVLGWPVLDTLYSMLRRLIDRKHIFMADRGHFYDLLHDKCRLMPGEVALVVYIFSIFLGVSSLCLI